jgi:D-alanyl-lipoteichoic acid acyltransferase DltB (MBOAT superfamily)
MRIASAKPDAEDGAPTRRNPLANEEISMVFSSTVFLFLFLPGVLILYNLPFVKSIQTKNIILLLASLGFYAWGEPVFVIVLLFSILLNWGAGLLIEKYGKTILILSLIYNVGVLFVCKYLTAITETVNAAAGRTLIGFSGMSLPIGISFFTFQIISYTIDVYRKSTPSQKNLFNLALYISMFPQLIAGPIVRYNTVDEQIASRTVTLEGFAYGLRRFMIGLGKKVLIANYMGVVADNLFGMTDGGLSVLSAWYGVLCYALQIYFDFSGYSDMAIGLGRMFGFHFEENFNYPYIADSISNFWRRWHISLSSWFRDYVYIPLGGSHVKKLRWIWNLFIVWLLTGIWHGANITFVLWGLVYFVFLLLERLTGVDKKLKWAYRIPTLLIVLLAWVLFRSDSLHAAMRYIGYMFGHGSLGFSDIVFTNQFGGSVAVFVMAIIGCTPLPKRLFQKLRNSIREPFGESLLYGYAMAVFILSVLVCILDTYNPFIYFNF